jgi:hypothetical protein
MLPPFYLSLQHTEAEEVKRLVRKVAAPICILAVDDLRLLGMQGQLAGRKAISKCAQKGPRLVGAFAVTDEVSRAVEFHRRALAEPDVRLAPHPAPIVRPRP